MPFEFPVTGLAVAWLTMSYRYSNCIFACAAKFLSAAGRGCAAMSNRAGSALAVPGVASISPGEHASAYNTAMRTQQLFDLISPHKNCSSYQALLQNRLLLRTPEKQTSRTIYWTRRIIMVKP